MGDQPSKVIKKEPSGRGDGQDASTVARQEREVDKKEVVLNRLRKQKLGLSEAELEEMALNLSNTERMKQRYFTDMLQSLQEAVGVVQKEKESRTEIRNQREQKTCMRGIAKEAYRVKTVEVKLALCTLRTRRHQALAELINKYVRHFEYGAFHAAIIIGDIVLEWNDSNLVIPRHQSHSQWIFRGSVHSHKEGSMQGVLGEPVPVRASREETEEGFARIIDNLEHIRMEKEVLVDVLVEVAVCYNTKHEYGILSNNCQHFVKDCLKVIGSSRDSTPFEGKVKVLVDHLTREGVNSTVTDDFATHEELDAYIDTHFSEMTVADLEYCICLYHLFHAFDDVSECPKPSCKADHLQKTLTQKRTTLTSS